MKTMYKTIGCALLAVSFFAACSNDDGYSVSTPVIESAAVTPTTFAFGDVVTLTARLKDAETRLATLNVSVVADNRTIAEQTITVGGNSDEVDVPILMPLVDNLPTGSDVKVVLSLKNVLKGEATREVSGLTGNRPYYSQLYLVMDDGDVYPLTPQAANKDRYEASNLTLSRSFSYKIAQKVSGSNQIDYSGLVWGNKNGKIALVDEKGESIFAFAVGKDYTQSFVYDNYTFDVTLSGNNLNPNDLALANFKEETIDSELFKTFSISLEKGQELTLFSELAKEQVVYNPDFFERLAPNKARFLGETGNYTLYYNTLRKHLLVGVNNPAYPNYLLLTGIGLGYPTKVSGIDKEHTGWGFGNARQFILFRKIAADVFQGTIFIKNADWTGFKPFENTGWGGEKRFDAVTITGEQVFESADGGDWHAAVDAVDANAFYRLTINWATNTVNVEKITL